MSIADFALFEPFDEIYEDFSDGPPCKTCKLPLSGTQDRSRSSDKWWVNCLSCRTANATRKRKRRDAAKTTTTRKHHTDSLFTSDVVLMLSEGHFAEQHPEKHVDTQLKERCVECDQAPQKTQVWKAGCGHILCEPCYKYVKMIAALFTRPHGLCKACDKTFSTCEPYELKRNSTAVKPTSDHPRYRGSKRTSHRKCSVCDELKEASEFVELSACMHTSDTCRGCFRDWVSSQLGDSSPGGIRCPSGGCTERLTHIDIKEHAVSEDFIRYDELSMRSFLSNDPDFHYCQAEGCKSGQMHDTSTEGYIFRCTACDFRFCTTCEVPFHTDETCTQYQERIEKDKAEREEELRVLREQEAASLAEVNNISVPCPGCGAHIQKGSGCDHMTWKRPSCRFEFCYVCLAPYAGANGIWAKGNGAHTTGCKYHTSNLPGYRHIEPPVRSGEPINALQLPPRVDIIDVRGHDELDLF